MMSFQYHEMPTAVNHRALFFGARLYTIYVYPLTTIIRRHGLQYHTYADDIQINHQCDNDDDAFNASIIRLQNCILEVIKWMTLQCPQNKRRKNGIYYLQ